MTQMGIKRWVEGGYVVHGLTDSGYPDRVFTLYLDEEGQLTDAEARNMHGLQKRWREVKYESRQWHAMSLRAKAIRQAKLLEKVETI